MGRPHTRMEGGIHFDDKLIVYKHIDPPCRYVGGVHTRRIAQARRHSGSLQTRERRGILARYPNVIKPRLRRAYGVHLGYFPCGNQSLPYGRPSPRINV